MAVEAKRKRYDLGVIIAVLERSESGVVSLELRRRGAEHVLFERYEPLERDRLKRVIELITELQAQEAAKSASPAPAAPPEPPARAPETHSAPDFTNDPYADLRVTEPRTEHDDAIVDELDEFVRKYMLVTDRIGAVMDEHGQGAPAAVKAAHEMLTSEREGFVFRLRKLIREQETHQDQGREIARTAVQDAMEILRRAEASMERAEIVRVGGRHMPLEDAVRELYEHNAKATMIGRQIAIHPTDAKREALADEIASGEIVGDALRAWLDANPEGRKRFDEIATVEDAKHEGAVHGALTALPHVGRRVKAEQYAPSDPYFAVRSSPTVEAAAPNDVRAFVADYETAERRAKSLGDALPPVVRRFLEKASLAYRLAVAQQNSADQGEPLARTALRAAADYTERAGNVMEETERENQSLETLLARRLYATTAPESYDGFGTRTVVPFDRGFWPTELPKIEGVQWRVVSINEKNVEWQTQRYASGGKPSRALLRADVEAVLKGEARPETVSVLIDGKVVPVVPFQVGQRVELGLPKSTSKPDQNGRHGVVESVSIGSEVTAGRGEFGTQMSFRSIAYYVRSDAGTVFNPQQEHVVPETTPAPPFVPDPQDPEAPEGTRCLPSTLLGRIGYELDGETRARGTAKRARKGEKKGTWEDAADKSLARWQLHLQSYLTWRAEHPESAVSLEEKLLNDGDANTKMGVLKVQREVEKTAKESVTQSTSEEELPSSDLNVGEISEETARYIAEKDGLNNADFDNLRRRGGTHQITTNTFLRARAIAGTAPIQWLYEYIRPKTDDEKRAVETTPEVPQSPEPSTPAPEAPPASPPPAERPLTAKERLARKIRETFAQHDTSAPAAATVASEPAPSAPAQGSRSAQLLVRLRTGLQALASESS